MWLIDVKLAVSLLARSVTFWTSCAFSIDEPSPEKITLFELQGPKLEPARLSTFDDELSIDINISSCPISVSLSLLETLLSVLLGISSKYSHKLKFSAKRWSQLVLISSFFGRVSPRSLFTGFLRHFGPRGKVVSEAKTNFVFHFFFPDHSGDPSSSLRIFLSITNSKIVEDGRRKTI